MPGASGQWDPEVPDIYPLGQGKGLLTDVINFGLNNLYQYGQKTKDFNQRMGAAVSQAQAGGNPDLGPLVSDVIGTSPLYTGVINWAGMTDPAKQMLRSFGQRYPKMIGAAEKMPAVLEASINPLGPDVAGALSKPVPSAHFMEVAPDYATNLPTIGHEIQHSLNAPRVAKTNPLDALTIGALLHDVLPAGNRGSLNTVLHLAMPPPEPNWFEKMIGFKQRPYTPNRNLMRNAMDEGLAYLGQNAAEGKGGDLVKTLANRLGVNWDDPRMVEGLGGIGNLEARIRHGTDVNSAAGIIKEGLRPGSSVSKAGGRDFEGYPVTLEFDDAMRGAKDYSSPFGQTMHEGAAKTGETAKDLKAIHFDPDEFLYREDALEAFRKLRESLDASGRKDLKITRARYNDNTEKWTYGEKLTLKDTRPFAQHVQKTNDRSLQRLFDETMDNAMHAPDDQLGRYEERISKIMDEMDKRGIGSKLKQVIPFGPSKASIAAGQQGETIARSAEKYRPGLTEMPVINPRGVPPGPQFHAAYDALRPLIGGPSKPINLSQHANKLGIDYDELAALMARLGRPDLDKLAGSDIGRAMMDRFWSKWMGGK